MNDAQKTKLANIHKETSIEKELSFYKKKFNSVSKQASGDALRQPLQFLCSFYNLLRFPLSEIHEWLLMSMHAYEFWREIFLQLGNY